MVPVAGAADGPTLPLESRVKAAALFRFLGYVEWPPSTRPGRDFYVIGVVGAPDVADELDAMATGRRINERGVAVRRIKPGDAFDDVDEVFVASTEAAQIRTIAGRLRGRPVLLVTQAEDGLARGGMVNFRIVDDHLRFEVALDNAEEAGLHLSSRMLSVAIQVTRASAR